MAFDFSTLITDRSQGDLDALRDLLNTPMSEWTTEQLAEFNQAVSKGAYNYTDLNRVTACMEYLNERLTALGYVTGYVPVEVPHGGSGSRLPEGYTELEYIESTGTQYINSGVTPDNTLRVVADYEYTQNAIPYPTVFGAWDDSVVGAFMLLTYASNWSTQGLYFGSVNVTPSVYTPPNTRHTIDANQNVWTLDENSLYTFPSTPFTGNTPIYIFSYKPGNNPPANLTSMRLYSMRMLKNGALIRDFVPCKNPLGEIGLYDLLGGSFYWNAGIGFFIAGSAIQTSGQLGPYTWYERDVPTASSMAAYLANVTALRGALILGGNPPTVPADMDGLSPTEANAIERILDVVNDYLVTLQEVFLRSDMAWAVSDGPNFYFAN